MFFKLLKEIPQLFAIAALIWGIVLLFFIRNNKKGNKSFLSKHKTTGIARLLGCLLTFGDIWLFIIYLPTHFKKHTSQELGLSEKDLLVNSSYLDSIKKQAVPFIKKDSTQKAAKEEKNNTGKTFLTNKASIRFLSKGSSEDIEATNHSVVCSFNNQTGQIKFTGLIKGFIFENELMQDHFNDKEYMNSEAFPKTIFTGMLENIAAIDFGKSGSYTVTAAGTLTIHGILKPIKATGILLIKDNQLSLKSNFTIKRIDFGINTDEIADVLEISVNAEF